MNTIETPNGPRYFLAHTPGNLGWSKIGNALHCSRMPLLDQQEAAQGSPGGIPPRPLFIGTLVHEAMAALFQRLKLVQEGNGEADAWVDPWTLLALHAARHAGTYVSKWVEAASRAFTTLAGIPKAGHETELPYPQAWEAMPDFYFLSFWGEGKPEDRYEVILVEEVCTWKVGDEEDVYAPRVDLVLLDRFSKQLLWIDWKTTAKMHRSQYPPHLAGLAEREYRNQRAFYECSGQFQAMFLLQHPRLPLFNRRVLVGNIHIPREMGVVFDPVEVRLSPFYDRLRVTIRDTIRFLRHFDATDLPGLAIPYASHHCVTTYGICRHWKKCYGVDLTVADGELTLEADGEDGDSI